MSLTELLSHKTVGNDKVVVVLAGKKKRKEGRMDNSSKATQLVLWI